MATNMYIRFEDPAIAGTSRDAGHENEIEVLSWSHGFTQPTSPTRGSGSVEQATHANLSFTKYLDGATNQLLKFSWSGKQIGKATLTCFRAAGATDNTPVKYLTVMMQHVIISNYSVSGGPGDIPVENVSLDYGVVQYEYVAQNGGSNASQHDLMTRTIS
jgi:type VI secretion system secreted protein Hcp